jgi:hypothetical protein
MKRAVLILVCFSLLFYSCADTTEPGLDAKLVEAAKEIRQY